MKLTAKIETRSIAMMTFAEARFSMLPVRFGIQPFGGKEKIVKIDELRKEVDRALGSNLYCAESVLLGVAKGLDIKSPLIPRIASGFCSGLSRTSGTCGAVNGGVMALGLIFGRDSGEVPLDGTYAKVQRFTRQFKETCGSCNCMELTGCDLGTEEGHNRYLKERMWEKCQDLTRKAVSMVAEIADCGDPQSAD